MIIFTFSIIAKVIRDRLMLDYDKQFPQYGFAIHKGYPTPQHKSALQKYGPCSLHRLTYKPVSESLARFKNRKSKKILDSDDKDTKDGKNENICSPVKTKRKSNMPISPINKRKKTKQFD